MLSNALFLHFFAASTEGAEVHLSKSTTVEDAIKVMAQKLELAPEDVRLWDFFQNSKYKLLKDGKQRLDDAQIHDNQSMLLEEKLSDGKFAPEEDNNAVDDGWHSGSSYHGGYNGFSGQYRSSGVQFCPLFFLSMSVATVSVFLHGEFVWCWTFLLNCYRCRQVTQSRLLGLLFKSALAGSPTSATHAL